MITNFDIQLLAWFTAVIAVAMSVYILLLYIPQRANRWLSLMLLFLAINGYATGMMAGAKTTEGVTPGMFLSACMLPAIVPGMLLAGLTLLKPTWLHGRWRLNRILIQVLIIVPTLFVAFDAIFGSHLMHKEFPLNSYTGGIVGLSNLLNGPAGMVFYIVNTIFTMTAACVILVYLAGFDKTLSPLTHRLAWILALSQIAIAITLFLPGYFLRNGLFPLAGSIIYIVVYTYATYQLSTPERIVRNGTWQSRGRQQYEMTGKERLSTVWGNGVFGGNNLFRIKVSLQARLTVLIFSVCLPLTITVALLISQRLNQQIRQDAGERLHLAAQSISQKVNAWLDASSQALTQMTLLPSIQDMDPEHQKPVLQAMQMAHSEYLLISTIDLNGANVSRSDQGSLQNYSDRNWFQEVKTGSRFAYQIVQDKSTGKPVFEMAVPIDNNQGVLVGAGMLTTKLSQFSSQIEFVSLGTTGTWYVIDAQNKVVFNPNTDLALRDYSQEPPVVNLRQNKGAGNLLASTSFKDNSGQEWLADGTVMNNGWAVITQQQKSVLYQAVNNNDRIVISILVIGTVLLMALIWLAIQHAVQPIQNLTGTATAIASGELTRVAQVDREDEIGILGRALNAITSQLRNSISELEKQIAERTLDLEVRSSYLQASTEISRIVASILDPDQLSQEVVNLIRERFGLYFVGLFQIDENSEWAILKAGTGKAGQNLLAQGYRIPVGSGMVGWSIANSQPRIAVDMGREPARQKQGDTVNNYPTDRTHSLGLVLDLPETNSEAALPLRSRSKVIGALSLQSAVSGAFDKDNITVFQILADQVAIALDNARLFSEGQETIRTMHQIYGEMSHEAWEKLLHEQISVAYRADVQGVSEIDEHFTQTTEINPYHLQPIGLEEDGTRIKEEPTTNLESNQSVLEIPIKVRGNVIGVLDTHKTTENPNWKPEEVAMVQTVADQLGLALESAQLYREAQYRAERERLISQITTQMRESLDVDTVLQTAAREMLNTLGLQDIAIHLGETPLQGNITARESTG